MKKMTLVAFGIVLSACSAASSSSTPVISDFSIATPVVPGAVSTGQVTVSNEAGLAGLELDVEITAPGGAVASSTVPVQGSSSADEGEVEVAFEIPVTAADGTYSLKLTVADGSDSSNSLTTTFVVGSGGTGGVITTGAASCPQLTACCESASYPSSLVGDCLAAASAATGAACDTAVSEYQALGFCGTSASSDAGTPSADLFCDFSGVTSGGDAGVCSAIQGPSVACTESGGTVVDACPSASLLGCCTLPGAGEECFYPASVGVGSDLSDQDCTTSLGTWSITP